MVLAAKIFVVKEEKNLPLLATKLKSFKLEQEMSVEDTELQPGLGDIRHEHLQGARSKGRSRSIRSSRSIRGASSIPVTRTFEAPFSFDLFGKNLFLTIFEKKSRANNVANEMSKALFMSLGQIVEAKIQPEVLKRFHEENFDNTKVIFFDGVDLPNISKLSLYGEALGNTTLYNDYLTHGQTLVHRLPVEEVRDTPWGSPAAAS